METALISDISNLLSNRFSEYQTESTPLHLLYRYNSIEDRDERINTIIENADLLRFSICEIISNRLLPLHTNMSKTIYLYSETSISSLIDSISEYEDIDIKIEFLLSSLRALYILEKLSISESPEYDFKDVAQLYEFDSINSLQEQLKHTIRESLTSSFECSTADSVKLVKNIYNLIRSEDRTDPDIVETVQSDLYQHPTSSEL